MRGTPAKVLASTATIRSARAGRRALWMLAFRSSLQPASRTLTPTSQLSTTSRAAESTSASWRPGTPRRRPSLKWPSPCSRLSKMLSLDAVELDAYWTLVAYHNWLRELGGARHHRSGRRPGSYSHDCRARRTRRREIDDDGVVELTSNVPGRKLPGILDRFGGQGRAATGLDAARHQHAVRRRRHPASGSDAGERAAEAHVGVHPGDQSRRAKRPFPGSS